MSRTLGPSFSPSPLHQSRSWAAANLATPQRQITETNSPAGLPSHISNSTSNSAFTSTISGNHWPKNFGGRASDEVESKKKYVVGIDYGTTFTSVSFFKCTENNENPQAFPWEVISIENWSQNDGEKDRKQVPTEIWYSSKPMNREPPAEQEENLYDAEEDNDVASRRNTGMMIGVNPDLDLDIDLDEDDCAGILWGYAVPYHLNVLNIRRNRDMLIALPKLQLVDTSYTQEVRDNLRPLLARLIKRRTISKLEDVFTDFMAKIFQHTKAELVAHHEYQPHFSVEFVVTVPTIWSQKSSRILQTAIESAMKISGFGILENGSVNNLYIISEPEAAAIYVLAASSDIIQNETFVVLDCGGGTVDGTTYTVDNSYPLRLLREEVPPGGDNCGASYLNSNFYNHLIKRLTPQKDHLERDGETLDAIVRRLIPNFENVQKRRVDITKQMAAERIYVAGVLEDKPRNLEQNHVQMRRSHYDEIFRPLLKRVELVLEEQLRGAAKKRCGVRVFLLGGFGAAPSLRSHLTLMLENWSRHTSYEIKLIADESKSCIAVSSGAVLRALNKANGPDRMAQSSYGFLSKEEYTPGAVPAHKGTKPTLDNIDGGRYLSTIFYFMIKDQLVPPAHSYGPFMSHHTFDLKDSRFLCEEELYVSDSATESHYTIKSARNKTAQLAGTILVDMTFLRTENKIQPVNKQAGQLGRSQYWRVEYELVAVVDGRNLRYYARWPPGGAVKGMCQVGIAAAFLPGTE